jgi:RNA polymerase sigma factor (sigma-70 family)
MIIAPEDSGRAERRAPRERALRNDRGSGEIAALVEQFAPLVRSLARRYEGRGAEREDLLQEGRLALLLIARRCTKKEMAWRLKCRLPGMVRDAASRMRRPEALSLDRDDEDDAAPLDVPDERAALDFEELELSDALDRLLDGTDREIARASLDGLTQAEIARCAGVSQQAVAMRLRKIRDVLRNGL